MNKSIFSKLWNSITHLWGKLTGRYYFEDFIRVYPDGLTYSRLGVQKTASNNELKNFLNHCKFYVFTAQFVKDSVVADIGCGSGYGCAILKNAGAARVCGADISRPAISFAKSHYGDLARFSIQSITDLNHYEDDTFDVVISSEVLEHIKEYSKEDLAVNEVRRITKSGGVIVFGTPNTEMLTDHGFSHAEIDALMSRHFEKYCIFENALVPFGESRKLWEQRLAKKQTGVMVAQAIHLTETVLPESVVPELKKGINPGIYQLNGLQINTKILHNTHSWIIVAIK
jgi:2-polyprenyl-3-methyl-5-hydroxy-6-metoxy-1,4-benzoquinol methylase